MNFEGDDLDWALGELLHMTWEAKCAGVLPHEFNAGLFSACLRVINSYPFEVRAFCHAIWQDMQPTVVYRPWRPRAYARTR